MTLYFIGIGLNDAKDISVKGLEIVKNCEKVYLENYTSVLNCKISELEKLYGKKIVLADRDMVEKNAENTILKDAKEKNTAFLVVGDVFGATTHIDLMMRARELNIETKTIHNASVLTAVGITGLELYKFGKVTSIPFENGNVKSPIEALKNNQKIGLHTLFLLDLNPEENKFLSINNAVTYLIKNKVSKDTMAVACCALGSEAPILKYSTFENLQKTSFNKFPQCLIIPGKLHFMEEKALELLK